MSGDLGPRGPCVGMMAGPTSPFCQEGGLQAEADGVWRALNALQRRLRPHDAGSWSSNSAHDFSTSLWALVCPSVLSVPVSSKAPWSCEITGPAGPP